MTGITTLLLAREYENRPENEYLWQDIIRTAKAFCPEFDPPLKKTSQLPANFEQAFPEFNGLYACVRPFRAGHMLYMQLDGDPLIHKTNPYAGLSCLFDTAGLQAPMNLRDMPLSERPLSMRIHDKRGFNYSIFRLFRVSRNFVTASPILAHYMPHTTEGILKITRQVVATSIGIRGLGWFDIGETIRPDTLMVMAGDSTVSAYMTGRKARRPSKRWGAESMGRIAIKSFDIQEETGER